MGSRPEILAKDNSTSLSRLDEARSLKREKASYFGSLRFNSFSEPAERAIYLALVDT